MKNDYGNWLAMLFSIILFLLAIKSAFRPKTKRDWKSFKMIGAFVVALFVEMYGFPLTIYLLTSFFGANFLNLNYSHTSGHLLFSVLGLKGDPHLNILHVLTDFLIIGGILMIASAWRVLYQAQKKGVIAQEGLYKFMRHPQYAGFTLLILGFLFQWPTLVTLIMAPILLFKYWQLARSEEKEMLKKFGRTYKAYRIQTPAFLPSLRFFLFPHKKPFSNN